MKSELEKKLESGIRELSRRIDQETDPEDRLFLKNYKNHLDSLLRQEQDFFKKQQSRPVRMDRRHGMKYQS